MHINIRSPDDVKTVWKIWKRSGHGSLSDIMPLKYVALCRILKFIPNVLFL